MTKKPARTQLWYEAGRFQSCLNEETIINYVKGNLKIDEICIIEQHLQDCKTCKEKAEKYQIELKYTRRK
jgi:hypothetical protein